jgi:hypothetical protein
MPQQRVQLTQGVDADNGLACQFHEATGAGIEHPQRDLDRPRIEVRRQAAANDVLGLADPREMNPDREAEPRVPAISNLSRLGTMGVPLLGCTTRAAAIARSGSARRRNSKGVITTRLACTRRASNTACPPSAPAWRAPRRRWTSLHGSSSIRLENQVPTRPRNRVKSKSIIETALVLKRRIELMLALPFDKLDELSLQREMRDIGTQ